MQAPDEARGQLKDLLEAHPPVMQICQSARHAEQDPWPSAIPAQPGLKWSVSYSASMHWYLFRCAGTSSCALF